MPSPNFILFITDQHRADYLGCFGHPVLMTPNIDGIAAKGTAFDRFYVASPVCQPNRSTLMTGRMPSLHGVRSNGIPLARDQITFVDLLRDGGYATALIGKSHLQNFHDMKPLGKPVVPTLGHQLPSRPLSQARRIDLTSPEYCYELPEFWAREDAHVATPFYGFDHVELITGHGDRVGGDYYRWLKAREPNADKLIGPANSLPHDYICPQAHRTAVPAELYSSAYIAERAEHYLGAARDAPFFLMLSFPDPHHPFNPPGKYWDMYAPDDFPAPEAFLRNDWTPPPHVRAALDARERGEANLKGMRSFGVSVREAQEARALTCGMIACIDDAIGRVLAALARSGRQDDTVLIFTTDHGDHLGDHRLLLKGAEQYQSLVHVPLVWSDPAIAAAPRRTNAIGSTIDIPATILDRAGIAPFAGMQGRSLVPPLTSADAQVRDYAFIQYEAQNVNVEIDRSPRIYSLIGERWRISVFQHAEWGELYDLLNDPGEFENLWDSPDHRAIRAGLMEKLVHVEMAHVDRVPLPTRMA